MARQEIMNALRKIAIRWGTTPPVAFLEGFLVRTTITKKDEGRALCVYLATRVTLVMTAIIYDIANEKHDEVNDLVQVKITAAVKEAVTRTAVAERRRGVGLDIGDKISATFGQCNTGTTVSDHNTPELKHSTFPGEWRGR